MAQNFHLLDAFLLNNLEKLFLPFIVTLNLDLFLGVLGFSLIFKDDFSSLFWLERSTDLVLTESPDGSRFRIESPTSSDSERLTELSLIFAKLFSFKSAKRDFFFIFTGDGDAKILNSVKPPDCFGIELCSSPPLVAFSLNLRNKNLR